MNLSLNPISMIKTQIHNNFYNKARMIKFSKPPIKNKLIKCKLFSNAKDAKITNIQQQNLENKMICGFNQFLRNCKTYQQLNHY